MSWDLRHFPPWDALTSPVAIDYSPSFVSRDQAPSGEVRQVSELAARLEEKFRTGEARLGTLGLGYVGLPLSVEFAAGGLAVTGFDLAADKVEAVNRGQSYIKDVPSE